MKDKIKASEEVRKPILPIVVMFFLFAMISFVTNLAAPIGTIWGYQFEGNSVLGMLGNMMNFLAYLFMGIPAGVMLERIGYKRTTLAAMAVGVAGLAIQYVSCLVTGDITLSFVIYLIGAFICGFCVCMLNTVVNPMLNLLGGGGNKGNQLLQTGATFNSLSATLTPLFVGLLIGELTKTTRMSNVAPLLWIAMGVFVVSFIVISLVRIPEPNLAKKGMSKPVYTHSPWNFRHTVLGVIGIFFYVGIEVGIPGTLNFYLSDQGAAGAGIPGAASAIAGAIVAIYWLLMLIGRAASSAISGKVGPRMQLTWVSAIAIILVMAAIILPKDITFTVPEFVYSAADGTMARVPLSVLLLVSCGLCTSLMWGGIFNLAVEGLGKYTAKASGIFMMMVVGGGVMPLLQQWIADGIGYMPSYWLVVIMLAYLLYYAMFGYRNVNTDIDTSIPDAV